MGPRHGCRCFRSCRPYCGSSPRRPVDHHGPHPSAVMLKVVLKWTFGATGFRKWPGRGQDEHREPGSTSTRRSERMNSENPTAKAQRVADTEEISRAIDALRPDQLVRLNAFAQNRIDRIGPRAAHGRTADDLLQEVVKRMLDGTRQWYPERADLVKYWCDAMRSISSAWAGHHDRNRASPTYANVEGDLVTVDDEGNTRSPFDTGEAVTSNPADEMVKSESGGEQSLADQIEASFVDDEQAALILMAWKDDLDGPKIREDLELTENQYRAAVRRIKRRARKIAEGHHGT